MPTQLENITTKLQSALDKANALPDVITLDPTLTQEGQAADAKAVGDRFNEIVYPVESVNGKTGTVILTASDVNAEPSGTVDAAMSALNIENGSGTGSVQTKGENLAVGDYTHVEGYRNSAFEPYSHAEGYLSAAVGEGSHSEGTGYGKKVQLTGEANALTYTSSSSFNVGDLITINDGYGFVVSSDSSAQTVTLDRTLSTTDISSVDAYVYRGYASGKSSHKEGHNSKATGYGAHVEGIGNKSSGQASHSEGMSTNATGSMSHAEGFLTSAEGDQSSTHGQGTVVKGAGGFAIGYYNLDPDDNSITLVEPTETTTFVFASDRILTTYSTRPTYTEGARTFTYPEAEEVPIQNITAGMFIQTGTLNVNDRYGEVVSVSGPDEYDKYLVETYYYTIHIGASEKGTYVFSIGNGNHGTPSNAHTTDWNGVGWYAGGLKVGGTGQDDEAAKEVATKAIRTGLVVNPDIWGANKTTTYGKSLDGISAEGGNLIIGPAGENDEEAMNAIAAAKILVTEDANHIYFKVTGEVPTVTVTFRITEVF